LLSRNSHLPPTGIPSTTVTTLLNDMLWINCHFAEQPGRREVSSAYVLPVAPIANLRRVEKRFALTVSSVVAYTLHLEHILEYMGKDRESEPEMEGVH
jgi:hypothetical protein